MSIKIKVSTPESIPLYPDVGGNLELKEDDRFTIYLKRQPAFEMAKSYYVENDKFDIDRKKYCLLMLDEIKNPITIEVDGKEREIKPEDIFEFPELSGVAWQVWMSAIEVNKGDIDPKK